MTSPTPARSYTMSRVRSKNTSAEMGVRRLLFAMGYRYRLHVRNMPGNPDIVMARHRTAIFVHGCFWHRHADCKRTTTPKTNQDFWSEKFAKTLERDMRAVDGIKKIGWRPLIIWECELRNGDELKRQLQGFFART